MKVSVLQEINSELFYLIRKIRFQNGKHTTSNSFYTLCGIRALWVITLVNTKGIALCM